MISVLPGMVATAMTRRQPDLKEVIITPEACAIGALNDLNSKMSFGGGWHEVTGFLTLCIVADLLP